MGEREREIEVEGKIRKGWRRKGNGEDKIKRTNIKGRLG